MPATGLAAGVGVRPVPAGPACLPFEFHLRLPFAKMHFQIHGARPTPRSVTVSPVKSNGSAWFCAGGMVARKAPPKAGRLPRKRRPSPVSSRVRDENGFSHVLQSLGNSVRLVLVIPAAAIGFSGNHRRPAPRFTVRKASAATSPICGSRSSGRQVIASGIVTPEMKINVGMMTSHQWKPLQSGCCISRWAATVKGFQFIQATSAFSIVWPPISPNMSKPRKAFTDTSRFGGGFTLPGSLSTFTT